MDLSGIFKAYDIRGKVGSELNADTVMAIGKAFADWLPREGVVAVGRDMRPDSAELATELIEGLTAQGEHRPAGHLARREARNEGQLTWRSTR